MRAILAFVKREPVRVFAIFQAAVVVAVAFGLSLSVEQTAALLGFAAVVLGVGEGVRSRVTPVE